jgi:hypothetical protein
LATVIREAVAPFIEELGQVQRLLGATEQELRQERELREAVEREHEIAKKELAGLRLLARTTERKRQDAAEQSAATVETESPTQPPNPPASGYPVPGGAGEAVRAPEKPQRWPWWMRILGGK